MSIPDYQTLMLPLLKEVSDGREHSFPSIVDALATEFKLSEAERRELLPSGGQFVFNNRVGWARTYMKKAGLLSAPKRGVVQITDRGLRVLKSNKAVNNKTLRGFPEFVEFQSKSVDAKEMTAATEQLDPRENIEEGYQRIRKQLSAELLKQIKECSPQFFERLVLDLLLKMGYGGSRRDLGEVVGKSGDGGVDVEIKEDKLGLDTVYIQAKRWSDGQVGSKEIQSFVGALHGKKARKGVFITTSGFSKPAEEYALKIQDKVVLINGPALADLMIEHGVGVSTDVSYDIKKIDSDYFTEE
ncbi:MAG: restriction endonuclease [Candidatus Sulfotelmatobacter sp.]